MDAQLAELSAQLMEARMEDDTAAVFDLLEQINKLLDQMPRTGRT